MKTKIKSIPFNYLPRAAHLSYCKYVSDALAAAPPALLSVLGTLPEEFNEWLAIETDLMIWVKKSLITGKIDEASGRTDRALVAIRLRVRAQQQISSEDISKAACRVHLMLQNYGRAYRKSYMAKLSAMLAISNHLGGDYAADAALLGLTESAVELREARAEFERLIELRFDESLGKPEKDFKTVMRSIEKVYHRITTLVNAGAAMNVSPDFAAFIDHLNPRIDDMNEAHHRVRRKMRMVQVDDIPPQTYAGLPVTPLPVVRYTTHRGETVYLQLGKDFNVAFRDNTGVGTAQCILRGKGLYEGGKMVTFVVASPL